MVIGDLVVQNQMLLLQLEKQQVNQSPAQDDAKDAKPQED
jgi:hypothetical protein